MVKAWDILVNVNGGGTTGQAGALTLGLARALIKAMPEVEARPPRPGPADPRRQDEGTQKVRPEGRPQAVPVLQALNASETNETQSPGPLATLGLFHGNNVLHVTRAKYRQDYRIWIAFNDGTSGVVDLSGAMGRSSENWQTRALR